jgi:hypothetical protein
MEFCTAMQELAQVFYLVSKRQDQYGKQKHKIVSPAGKANERIAETVWTGSQGQSNPRLVIEKFCNTFSFTYAKTELLDMLEAVITYKGVRKRCKENLILFYQCLDVLIRFAHRLSNGKQCLRQLKKAIDRTNKLVVADL